MERHIDPAKEDQMAKLFWLTSADPDLCMDSSGRDNAEAILDTGNAFPTLEAAKQALQDGLEAMYSDEDQQEPVLDFSQLQWEEEPTLEGHEKVWRMWHEETSTWAQIREVELPWLG